MEPKEGDCLAVGDEVLKIIVILFFERSKKESIFLTGEVVWVHLKQGELLES